MSEMDWDPDAKAALDKAPFFVRPLARRKVEERVRARGGDRVTLADVREGEARFRAAAGGKSDAEVGRMMPKPNEPGAEMIAVEVCHCELSGCPNAVLPPAEWKAAIEDWARESDVGGRLRQRVKGDRILLHHRFRVSISGCPNGCSRPQIADVGLVGWAKPVVDARKCDACGACERACPDGAVEVDGQPFYDRELCVGCALCRNACPTDAIELVEPGMRLLMGGKLGRRPHLGELVGVARAPCEAARCIDGVVNDFLAGAEPGERFANWWIRTQTEGRS